MENRRMYQNRNTRKRKEIGRPWDVRNLQ
jgi:hypothetical protein